MKNLCKILVFIMFLVPASLFSQDKTTIISGEVKDCDKVVIYLYQNYNDPIFSKIVDSVVIDNNKKFNFKIFTNNVGFYTLLISNKWLYNENEIILFPGDSVFISQAYDNKTLFFTGKGAAVNNYMQDLHKDFIPIIQKIDSILRLPVKTFTKFVDERTKSEQMHLETYIGENESSKRKVKILKDLITFHYANLRFLYSSSYDFTHNNNSNKQQKIDQSFFSFINDIDIYDTEVINCYQYQTYLHYYTDYLLTKSNLYYSETTTNPHMNKFEVIKQHLNGVQKDYAIYMLSKKFFSWSNMYYSDFENQISVIKTYLKETQTNQKFLEEFDLKAREYIENTRNLKMKNFSYPDSIGKIVSLSDFADKIVYIKLWTLWCVPCIKSMPEFNNLISKYEADSSNIVFINICIDLENKKAKWLSQIKKSEIKGISLYCDNDFSAEYKRLTFFPNYILLDRENKIVLFQAKSPTDCEKDIETLLLKN